MKGLFKFLLLLLFFGVFLFKTQSVLAQEMISSFDTKYTLHQNGSFSVEETIVYDFGSDNRHGIFREIPLTAKVGDLYRESKITLENISRDNAAERFANESSDYQFKVRIGDPDKTITGVHTYNISYLVENGTTTYDDHDELYWNVTGNGWLVPISKASVTIDTDFGVKPDNYICFTGMEGYKDKNCSIDSVNSRIDTTTVLLSAEGLTFAVSFPPKTFPSSILTKTAPGSLSDEAIVAILIAVFGWIVLVNVVLPLILIIWYFKTKRKNRFGPITVNFDIPKDKGKRILPAEVGTMDTASLDRDDVIGTIFDLAIRKLIKLEEVDKKTFLGLGKSKTVRIKKLKDYKKSGLNNFEITLLDKLFEDGDEVEIDDIGRDFYKTFNQMGDEVFEDHVKNGYYTKNPKNQRTALIVFGVLSMVFGGYVLGIVLLVFSSKLNGRTALGDELDWKIDGLKLFLKSMDRNYKWQAEQLYVVEQMIPYAIALGYIEKYMEQLKIIKPDYHPGWYSGRSSFYTFFPSMSSSMTSSFVTSAPSSSSGFSGGGSSGGGGGGGGGGSW